MSLHCNAYLSNSNWNIQRIGLMKLIENCLRFKSSSYFLWCCIWNNLMKSYNRKWWTELQFEFSKWLADLVYLVKWKPQNRRIRFRGKFRENWKYCMASFQFVSLFSGFRITLICKFPGNVPDRWVMIGVTARKFLGISSSYENESSINE